MYPIHRGAYIQRGRGLGAVISRIFGKLIPWLGRSSGKILKSTAGQAAKRVAKKSLKKVGNAALKSAANAAASAIAGESSENIKSGVHKDIKAARREIADTLRSEINTRDGGKKSIKGKPVSRPSAGSKVARRKKAVKSLLD